MTGICLTFALTAISDLAWVAAVLGDEAPIIDDRYPIDCECVDFLGREEAIDPDQPGVSSAA
jgi:hypothetical protein